MGLEDVPDKMLAAQVVEYNKPYKIHEVSTPKDLNPHALLLKTAVASYCHTDQMVREGVMETKLPCIGSHEGTGTVVAVGSEVKNFKEGDRVMSHVKRNACGHCPDCLGPDEYKQYCRNFLDDIVGVTKDGAFAEYFVADSRWSVKLPDSVTFRTAAPLACAGGTAFRAVKYAGLKAGEWIAIVGSGGGLGHLAIQFAKQLGLNVIGLDANDGALELSKKLGADLVVDVRKGSEKVIEEVKGVTGGELADATVNVSDAAPAAATAVSVTKQHGTMWQIAQPNDIVVPFRDIIFRDIRIRGSVICSPGDAKDMIDVVDQMGGDIVTATYFKGLHELPKLLEAVHGGKINGKAVVLIDESQGK